MSEEEKDDPALRMLLKMGYEPGKGLGKRGEGIIEPVKATVHPKNTGLGFTEAKAEAKEEVLKAKRGRQLNSRKVLEEGQDSQPEVDSEIDSMEYLDKKHIYSEGITNMIWKLKNILSRSEWEFTKSQTKVAQIPLLKRHLAEIEISLNKKRIEQQTLEDIKGIKQRSRFPVTIYSFDRLVKSAQFEEHVLLSLYSEFMVADLDECKYLSELLDPVVYMKLLQINWLPSLKQPALDIFTPSQGWWEVLPYAMKRYLYRLYIQPHLQAHQEINWAVQLAVEMDDQDMLILLRRKIGLNLKALPDSQLLAYLKEWRHRLPKIHYLAMCMRSVVPLLSKHLDTLLIDPRQQQTGPLKIVLPYLEVLPEVCHEYLFNQLLENLSKCFGRWLSADPDYFQVSVYYKAWRRLLPKSVSMRPVLISIYRSLP